MTFSTYELVNGIKLIHYPTTDRTAYCGLMINSGSRDEKPNQHGIAHFIEHALFKGTTKRKSHHIINRLESVGGELNAFTTKEETCIYASILSEDFERSVELIADMAFNSSFPEKELIKEKEVIIDEILSYRDNPAELIFDDFEEQVFKGNSIGRNILGTPKSLNKIERREVLEFIDQNYRTNKMVFVSVGNINFNMFVKICNKYLGQIPPNISPANRVKVTSYTPTDKKIKKRTYQSHCITGSIAFDLHDARRITMVLLNNIIGGPGMNAKLNVALREKRGLAYNVESHYSAYSDTGLFTTYFGCERDKLELCLELIKIEFTRLRNTKLSDLQLHRSKKQLTGQLTIGWEHKENLMLSIGKSYLHFNKVDTMEDVYNKIGNISSSGLIEVANIVLDQDKMSQLIYQ